MGVIATVTVTPNCHCNPVTVTPVTVTHCNCHFNPIYLANHAGGTAGGISTGQPVVCRVAFKPTSSILTPVESINAAGEAVEVVIKVRHDPCVGIRGTPVVEAMMALVLADHKLLHRGQVG